MNVKMMGARKGRTKMKEANASNDKEKSVLGT